MKTILLIEDESATRLRLKTILVKAGYRVLEDTDGSQALDLFRAEHPDLILCDINLPETSGIEIITGIRVEEDLVPIIAMSAGDRLGNNFLDETKELGASDVLYKPFSSDELMAKVSRWLT